MDIYILSCQRVNKGHSFFHQLPNLLSPPPPEEGREEKNNLEKGVLNPSYCILPISNRARHEQLNLGLPCGLWITQLCANHQGTKADNKRGFLFFVYPSGHCLPYHWRGSYHLIPFGSHSGLILYLQVSDWLVMKWACQLGVSEVIPGAVALALPSHSLRLSLCLLLLLCQTIFSLSPSPSLSFSQKDFFSPSPSPLNLLHSRLSCNKSPKTQIALKHSDTTLAFA